jgi:cell division protein FtsB
LDNVAPQIIDLQQRLDKAQNELAQYTATMERSTQQNHALETQVRDLETQVGDFALSNADAQRLEEVASEAKARSDEHIAEL